MGGTITITGTLDEPLTEEEYLRLIDWLGQLGISNVDVKESN